jgi:hypothetical protein
MIQISSCLQLEKCVGKLPQRERERERERVCVCVCVEKGSSLQQQLRRRVSVRTSVLSPSSIPRIALVFFSYRFAEKQSIALAEKLCFAKKQKALIDCLKDEITEKTRQLFVAARRSLL